MSRTIRYVPMLTSKCAELTALHHMALGLADSCTPMIEVVPIGDQLDNARDPHPMDLTSALERALDRIRDYWNPRFDLMVDTHRFWDPHVWNPIEQMIDDFARAHMFVIPTVWLSDPVAVLSEVGAAVRHNYHEQVCLRLTRTDLHADREIPLSTRIERTIRALDLSADEVHLLLDLGTVASEREASAAADFASAALSSLPHVDGWRSITLACGGFPDTLQHVPPEMVTLIRRWEEAVWRSVRRRLGGRIRVLSFGDYAIAHPPPSQHLRYRSAPQIRYTTEDTWLVLKGRLNHHRGNAQFLDICGRIAKLPDFTPGLTWGDEEIAQRARAAEEDADPAEVSPGNATIWRAIGTSHHIGFIANHIEMTGEP